MDTPILAGVLAACAVMAALRWLMARDAACRCANARADDLLRTNRLLRMASRCREALLHAKSAEEMMAAVCRGLSDEGSYALVWVGLPMAGSSKDLLACEIQGTPAGHFAAAAGGLRRGCGLSGMALEFGYPSALSLPLPGAGEEAAPIGVLYVYSAEPAAFGSEEVALLTELSSDLAQGISNIHEADKRRAAEQAMACQPQQDPVTGLANRALFNDRLQQALVAAERNGRKVAVLALTLDRYRAIKGALGNDACSALQAHAASAIKSCLHEGDTVAHLLGNEFAVILADLRNDDDVLPVAATLLDAVKASMRWRDNIVHSTASIGIAMMGEGGGEASGMLRSANLAMAVAAGHGGNRFRFVAPEMNDRAARRFALEAELRRALVHNEMVVHYQPRAALRDGSLTGAEALVRWQHPARGLLPPAEFLALAESSGLIVPLGAWMIREVCRQQRAWRDAGLPLVPVSINLSSRQFREEGLVEHIEVALAEYGLPPATLGFDISESTVMEDLGDAVARMNELKAIGVSLSLDDFGTGGSSLACLRLLPLDQLKIEQSFVRQLGSEQADEAICRSIIDVGHNLNMLIVGEGVATLLQQEWLRDHYCDEIQGCFFARPMVPEDLARLLAADRPRSNTMLPVWKAFNYRE